MHKFIKTFYLWLGLFSLCNLASLVSAFVSQHFRTDHLALYPVAWTLQLPLVLFLAVAHYGINHLFSFLPMSGKKAGRFVLCTVAAILFMGTYVASQQMYDEINSFIAWDALQVAFDNTLQIIPDIGRSNTVELTAICLLALGISFLYTRRYHNHSHMHSPKIFAILCAAFLATGAGGFSHIYSFSNDTSDRIRRELLPTTYLTLSIIDGILPSVEPTTSALVDLVLEPAISLDEFLPADSMPSKPNVFFIMLESISWDRFGFTGYSRKAITPHLDALAQQSVVFPRTYATANHSNYSQTSTHASQYPLRRKRLDQFENIDYPKTLLFDILSHAGYQTAFFSAQNEDWQGMKSFTHAHTELQHYFHSKDELGNNIGIESKIDDALVRTRAVEFLEQRNNERPLFMYLNFQATHFPYEINANAPRPFQPCDTDHFKYKFFHYDRDYLPNVINKFDNALHYVDAQVGAFIENLKKNGLYEDSLIVVAADHGEAFYERGYPTHGTSLFEDQMRTTSLFKLPRALKTETRADPISLIDINPTILEILGHHNHPNFQGQQVLNKPRNSPIYLLSHGIIKSHGIIDHPWKYIISERDGEWLLNLEKNPEETTDFSAEHRERLKQLKYQLDTYQQRQMYYYNILTEEDRQHVYPPQH
jgi:arylsulfatase A-like enzyme